MWGVVSGGFEVSTEPPLKNNLVMYRLAQPQNYVIQETGLSRDHAQAVLWSTSFLRNNDD